MATKKRKSGKNKNKRDKVRWRVIEVLCCAAIMLLAVLCLLLLNTLSNDTVHISPVPDVAAPIDSESVPGAVASVEGTPTESAAVPHGDDSETAALPDTIPPTAGITPPSDVTPPSLSFPMATPGASLALVLDDAGGDIAALRHCLTLPFPVTVAVMPGLVHSKECADIAREARAEVLLHQPMQAQDLDISPGPQAVTPEMTTEEAAALVAANMESLGGVAGVNNHEGSLITEDADMMAAIMQTVQDEGAYFLDSRTTSQTHVGEASAATGIPYYKRDVFLDNSHDREAILEQVRRALAIANRSKAAIMIGHVRSDDALVSTLTEIAPELQQAGYRFCTVSQTEALRRQ